MHTDTASNHLRETLTVAGLALALSAIASAPSLQRWALRKSDGWQQQIARAAVAPAVVIARRTRLFDGRTRAGAWLYPEQLPQFHAGFERAEDPPPVERSAGASARSSTTTTRASITVDAHEDRRFDARHPLRVWVAGDSMAFNFGLQLDAMARRSGVMRVALDSQPSTGLIDRGDVQWLPRLRQTITTRRPHVFVLSFGANDADVLRHRGVAYAPLRPEWREGYLDRARAVMDLFPPDRAVYWLGMPIMRSAAYAQKIAVMNSVFQEQASAHSNVRFVETASRYAAPDGSFSAFLPDRSGRLRLLRMEDGIHYTPEGARQLAAHVFEMLCDRYIVGGRCP